MKKHDYREDNQNKTAEDEYTKLLVVSRDEDIRRGFLSIIILKYLLIVYPFLDSSKTISIRLTNSKV